jgi:hypothetical protein
MRVSVIIHLVWCFRLYDLIDKNRLVAAGADFGSIWTPRPILDTGLDLDRTT